MDAITFRTHVNAPRQEVYSLLADVAARPSWCDHYMTDYRLVSPRAVGVGGGARFRLDWPGGTRYVEFTIVEARPPRLLVEEGRTGRLGRTRYGAEYELTEPSRGMTRVELTVWTEPENAIERLRELAGFRRFMRGRTRKALDRLRRIFEEGGGEPSRRATIAGYEARKAPRFGVDPRRRFEAEPEESELPEARPGPGRVGG